MFSSSILGTHSPTHTVLWAERYCSLNSCPQNCEGIKVSLCRNGQPVAICSSSPRRLIYLDTLQSPIHPLLLKGKLLTANKPRERQWKIPLLWPKMWHLPPLCPSLSIVATDCLFSCSCGISIIRHKATESLMAFDLHLWSAGVQAHVRPSYITLCSSSLFLVWLLCFEAGCHIAWSNSELIM